MLAPLPPLSPRISPESPGDGFVMSRTGPYLPAVSGNGFDGYRWSGNRWNLSFRLAVGRAH